MPVGDPQEGVNVVTQSERGTTRPAASAEGAEPTSTGRLLRTTNLRVQLAEGLRERLRNGEWAQGSQLPTEAALTAEYGVSRSTVRAALQQLEAQGLTITRHGTGTFVSPYGHAITAGLQELQSMSDTIRSHGMVPKMDYHSVRFRGADAAEAAALGIPEGTRVLATERTVIADDIIVAYSYEVIPGSLLPADLKTDAIPSSLFGLLEQAGIMPHTAVTELHAACGPEIGWGERDPNMVYVYLHQIHHDSSARPITFSRTYFHEGRFQFSILRVR